MEPIIEENEDKTITTNKEIKEKKEKLNTTPTPTIINKVITRGQKRAKETYDYIFGNIVNTEADIKVLLGYDLIGPSENELTIYFNQFPKQQKGSNVITKDDLINYLKTNYTSDQLNSVTPPTNVDEILKSMDLNSSGQIELDDFVDSIQEKIFEQSKSLGLIIEIDSEDEKPRKRKQKPTILKIKGTKKEKKEKKEKKKDKKVKKSKDKKEKSKKVTAKRSSTLKYNYEKIAATNQLESSGANNKTGNKSGEGSNNNNTSKSMWQYKFSTGWLNYQEEGARVVEEAYQDWLLNSYIDVRSVKSGQFSYQIDFRQMTQTNLIHHDHTTREIRRVLIPIN